MRGDEGSLALASNEQILSRHFIDRLAHSALTDIEACREFNLTGNRLARTPLAGLKTLQEQALDLTIQGTESR